MDKYRERILEYNKSLDTHWKRFRRWFNWTFRHVDFCPECNKPTKWHIEIFRAGDNLNGIPLFAKYHCSKCGLETNVFGALVDVLAERKKIK